MSGDRVAVVTDSTADIPDALAEEMQIQVVRNTLVIDGQPLIDGIDITRPQFYERLPQIQSVSTATASPGTYSELYERLFNQGYSHIVSIHLSSKLSGVINAAEAAARSFGGRVRTFDSLQVSLGSGFQSLAAAEASLCGSSFESILKMLENSRPRARVIALLDTLEYVRRSGRVSWAKARLGDLLQIKAFIEIKDGVVESRGESRTRRKGVARLREMLLAQAPFERLAILHTHNEDSALQFLEELRPDLPAILPTSERYEPLIVNITSIIGAHVGPNALAFAGIIQAR